MAEDDEVGQLEAKLSNLEMEILSNLEIEMLILSLSTKVKEINWI